MEELGIFEIPYVPIKISLRVQNMTELPPYLGSALRGVIGKALYYTDGEAYHFLYENGKRQNGVQDIVKPYVIIPPEISRGKNILESGERLNFEILLFGTAVSYITSLIKALEKIGEYGLGAQRYPFELIQITNSQSNLILWRKGMQKNLEIKPINLSFGTLPEICGVIVYLQTPLRIRRNGALVSHISFLTLIRNIVKRIGAITDRYGGWMNGQEADRIQKLAEEVCLVDENIYMEHMERYSNRMKKKMDFSGIMGEIEFAGNITPFVPWLLAAQILHIGRNTTFGMGKIEVYFLR